MENYISEIVSKASENLQAQKQELLSKRILDRIIHKGLLVVYDKPFNYQEETVRRFPRIKCEFNNADQSEHYYWNDNTEQGLHLISFYQDLDDIKLQNQQGKFTIGIRYH